MARPRIYQRKFLIKKEFQWKFISLYALTVSAIVGLTTYVMYWQIDKTVERHLYSVHIHAENVGDLLLGLMFQANFVAVLAIVLMVILLSLGVFRLINRHFYALRTTVSDMSQGIFSDEKLPSSSFLGVDRLSQIIEQTRTNYRDSYTQLEEVLKELEFGCSEGGRPESLQAAQVRLGTILNEISLEK